MGLAADGTTPLGNGGDGIHVDNPWESTFVGGTSVGARNVVSSNAGGGITVDFNYDVFIEGNYVGTDITGTLPRGNVGFGIVAGSTGRVGGTAPGSGNIVAANVAGGIQLRGRYVPVYGNRIGVSAAGTPLGNLGDGISAGWIDFAADFANNMIGGSAPGEANDIRFNGGDGVSVVKQLGQRIIGNRISENGGIGIDLNADGPTPNDTGDTDFGANALQNTPVLAMASQDAGTVHVTGTLDSIAQKTYRIDLYASPSCFLQGDRHIGTIDVTTDSSGFAAVSLSSNESLEAMWISATATDLENGTSEFSTCVQVRSANPTGADLGITGSASPNPVESGANATYTIAVSNAGPEAATATAVIVDVPVGTTLVSASVSQGTWSGPAVGTRGLVTFSIGDLPLAATVTATVVVTVTAAPGSTIGFAASATSQRADPSTINNTTASTLTVAEQGTTPIADVSLVVSGPTEPVATGTVALFTFTVANAGPSPATDVILATAVPNATTLHSIGSTGGTLSAPPVGSSGPINCAIASLGVGESVVLSLTMLVSSDAGPTFSVDGGATSAVQDNAPANNSATASVSVTTTAPPVVSGVQPLTGGSAPYRIKLLGDGFKPGIQIYIGEDSTPWPSVAFKNSGKLVLKQGGPLKRRFPKGVAVSIRLVNPDGGVATIAFTR